MSAAGEVFAVTCPEWCAADHPAMLGPDDEAGLVSSIVCHAHVLARDDRLGVSVTMFAVEHLEDGRPEQHRPVVSVDVDERLDLTVGQLRGMAALLEVAAGRAEELMGRD